MSQDKDKELIELAKEQLKKDKPKYIDYKIEAALKDLNINKGTVRVPAAIIYYMYYENFGSPVTPRRFFMYMKNNFESQVVRNETHYFIDGAGIDLSFGNIFKARQLMAKHYGKKAKKKKNK
jgi:hypothetical protein